MSEELRWVFPVDNADQWDGFNESGINTFSGSPITHLAREVIQNSIDAGTEGAVKVSFNLMSDRLPIINLTGRATRPAWVRAGVIDPVGSGQQIRGLLQPAADAVEMLHLAAQFAERARNACELADSNLALIDAPAHYLPFLAYQLRAYGVQPMVECNVRNSADGGIIPLWSETDIQELETGEENE